MMRLPSKRFGQHGFTLMEMMVVVVMIGVLAAVAGPEWYEQLPRLETKAQVREVVSKLREARSQAVARKEPCGVCFDNYNNEWKVFVDNSAPFDTHDAGDSVLSLGPIGQRVTMSYNSFNNDDCIFNPDGSAAQSGVVCLEAEDNSLTYTIDVLASTGRVKLIEGYFPYGDN